MNIEMTLGNMITVVLSVAGLIAALIKLLMAQQLKHIDKSFDSQNRRLDRIELAGREEAGNWQRVERELSALKADLPLNYVRREDYIRGQSVIEAKLDSVASQIQNAQLQAQLAVAQAAKTREH